ncbi:unnamed protein product, partial [Acanthoscelides obtectus]
VSSDLRIFARIKLATWCLALSPELQVVAGQESATSQRAARSHGQCPYGRSGFAHIRAHCAAVFCVPPSGGFADGLRVDETLAFCNGFSADFSGVSDFHINWYFRSADTLNYFNLSSCSMTFSMVFDPGPNFGHSHEIAEGRIKAEIGGFSVFADYSQQFLDISYIKSKMKLLISLVFFLFAK